VCKKQLRANHNQFLAFVLVALLGAPGAVAQTTIEIFSDSPLMAPTMSNAVVRVFDLSHVAAVKKNLPRFSPDQALATVQAKAWLDSPAGKAHKDDVKAAYAGHAKMIQYGLQKIPAIVFEQGKFVIYGTTDLHQAVADYDQYRRTHSPILSTPNNTHKGAQHE
jgi:integrating conjugative element protein (TIGR03757 family)